MKRLFVILPLVLLVAGSGGCYILTPTIPTCAAGYGHTYNVTDPNGKPLGAGFLLLDSQYASIGGPEMYNCYDVKDGRAEVPSVVAVRATGNHTPDDFPLLFFIRWSNPNTTAVIPFVPGYVPGSMKPPPDIHLVKADRDAEIRYLKQYQFLRPSYDLWQRPPMLYYSQAVADNTACTRVAEYVAARLKELGYKPETAAAPR
jgi:hypothetical protein